jgi:anti-sigma regulatory factor (Ser/Thr protein kinase)
MHDAMPQGGAGTLSPVEAFSIEADVPGGPDAARRARGLVRRELTGQVPIAVLGDIVLLVTELVANGVRHGGADAASELHLRLERDASTVRIEVEDPGVRPQAVVQRATDEDGGGGIGLQLVEALASRWGVGAGPQTSVWFEFDCR